MAIATILIFLTLVLVIAGAILALRWQHRRINQLLKETKELRSLTKSQQVKFGKSFEHFVPFIKDFPADKENTIFLGMPLDFISFQEDCIKFIEVKTGQSQLSSKQKHIKKLIEGGAVEWHELRY